jgi:NAD(P)H-nitrite reductase large subunit
VDFREDPENPVVSLAYEVTNRAIKKGDEVLLTDLEGNPLQRAEVVDTIMKKKGKTQIIKVRIPKIRAKKVAGFKIQDENMPIPRMEPIPKSLPDEAVVCRCERVRAGEIRRWIRAGVRDMNQIKAITRAGMGACGAKTCETLILQLFNSEGIPLEAVSRGTRRPLFMEAPLGALSNLAREERL